MIFSRMRIDRSDLGLDFESGLNTASLLRLSFMFKKP